MSLFIPPPPRLPSFDEFDEDEVCPISSHEIGGRYSSWPPPSTFDTDPCPPPEFP